jgi:hypothetical protein
MKTKLKFHYLPKKNKKLDETLPVHQITDQEINDFCKEESSDELKVIWIGN